MRRELFVVAVVISLGGCTSSALMFGDSGRQLTTAELQRLLPGKAATFSGGETAVYSLSGQYAYREKSFADHGRYSFRHDQVCVVFENGSERCDPYFRHQEQYTFVTARGQRFPATIH